MKKVILTVNNSSKILQILINCPQALLLAKNAHDAASIRPHTIAVIFMGTPHRGSQLASYADTAVACIKVLGIKANKGIIQQIKFSSEDLEELGSQFSSLLQLGRMKVLTFFEMKPTKIAGLKITESLVRGPKTFYIVLLNY